MRDLITATICIYLLGFIFTQEININKWSQPTMVILICMWLLCLAGLEKDKL